MDRRHCFWLFAILALTAGSYSLGLSGSFYFDDYGQIVWNSAFKLRSLDWDGFLAAATSSAAGPLGRPIAMLSLSVEEYFFGMVPFHFKLSNVLIHILNGLLVAWLATEMLAVRGDKESRAAQLARHNWKILLLTAWWIVHPLSVTAVLYVIQRMTSLSATFTLLGLALFLAGRRKANFNAGLAWYFAGVFGLLIMSVLSTLTKENGILTLGYAWLIEIIWLRHVAPLPWQRKIDACLLRWLPGMAVVVLSFFLVTYPDWFGQVYADRPFTLIERLLTQGRVLWFYLRQIVLPVSSDFGLYHDGFVLSKSWFSPWTTLPAIIGHAALVGIAWYFQRTLPLMALGVLWFYLGHSIESTVLPLELVFEHRNYLPQLGIMLAVVALIDHLGRYRRLFTGVLVVLIALSLLLTTLRALAMGNAVVYPIYEATRHQTSARANFDAGLYIVLSVENQAQDEAESHMSEAKLFLDRAVAADPNSLAPYIGLMKYAQVRKVPFDREYLEDFEKRLRYGVPPRANGVIARLINEQLSMEKPVISQTDGERLFQAALNNLRITGYSRSVWKTAYALFLSNLAERKQDGIALMREVIRDSPSHAETYVILAAMLIDQNQLEEAHYILGEASKVDLRRHSAAEIQGLSRRLDQLRNEIH